MQNFYSTLLNESPATVAVSACLLGELVRYDGKHKRDSCVSDRLASQLRLIAVCPEVGIGLGVPRDPMQLGGSVADPIVIGRNINGEEIKKKLQDYARQQSRFLNSIHGYIFKSRSPSCGVGSVPLMEHGGDVTTLSSGIFAHTFLQSQPMLPYLEETQLAQAGLYDHFLEKVFFAARWSTFVAGEINANRLYCFFAMHEMQLASHGVRQTRALKSSLSSLGETISAELILKFQSEFHAILRVPRVETTALENLMLYILERGQLEPAIEMEFTALENILSDKRNDSLHAVAIAMNKSHFTVLGYQTLFNPGAAEFQLRFNKN